MQKNNNKHILINRIKKQIINDLSYDKLHDVQKGLNSALLMGVPNLLNTLMLEKLDFNRKIKLIRLGADADSLVESKINSESFYDLVTLAKSLPGHINWVEKSQLFYDRLHSITNPLEKKIYQERIEFFLPQILSFHRDAPDANLIPYDKIIYAIEQKQDYSVYSKIVKNLTKIDDKDYMMGKILDYCIKQKSDATYAVYSLFNKNLRSADNKFALFFLEQKNGFFLEELFKHSNLRLKDFSYSLETSKPKNKEEEIHQERFHYFINNSYKHLISQQNTLRERKVNAIIEQHKNTQQEAFQNPFFSLSLYGERENKPKQRKTLIKMQEIVSQTITPDVTPEKSVKESKPIVTHIVNQKGERISRKDLQKQWDKLLINDFFLEGGLMGRLVGQFLKQYQLNYQDLQDQNATLNRMPLKMVKKQWFISPRLFVCSYVPEAAELLLSQTKEEVLSNTEKFANMFSQKRIKTLEGKLSNTNQDVKDEIKEIRKTKRDYSQSTRERVIQRDNLATLKRSSWNTVK